MQKSNKVVLGRWVAAGEQGRLIYYRQAMQFNNLEAYDYETEGVAEGWGSVQYFHDDTYRNESYRGSAFERLCDIHVGATDPQTHSVVQFKPPKIFGRLSKVDFIFTITSVRL